MQDKSEELTNDLGKPILTGSDALSAMEMPLYHAAHLASGLVSLGQVSTQIEEPDRNAITEFALAVQEQIEKEQKLWSKARGGGGEQDAVADVAAKLDPFAVIDQNAYVVEIQGDGMLPVYRSGDIVMVSPSATVREGDRVIVKTTDGQVMARLLKGRTAKSVELASFDGREPTVSKPTDIDWIARIIWATQ